MTDVWKTRLLPASWRGIPFFIEAHELQGGRHAIPHEPPERKDTFAEDIGKKTKRYKIEAHLLGDTYFFIRDGIIKAMDEQGKGILVHPYFGFKEVQAVGYTVRETTDEGRICRLSLEFIDAGQPSFPFSAIDAVTDFVTSAVVAVAQVKNAFQVAFKLAELPAFAKASAESMVSDFTTSFNDGFKNVRLNGEKHSELKRKNDTVSENTSSLVDNPASLIEEIDGLLEGLKDLVPDAPDSFTIDSSSGRDDKIAVFLDFLVFRGGADDITGATPTRIQERANADALADAIQQLAIIRLAEQAVSKDFKSNNEAADLRTSITDAIQRQLDLDRTSDEIFQALEDLNAKLVVAVPNTKSQFSNERTITKLDTVPTIMLAYDLYEAAENEQDIIDRNKIRNPAFAVGQLTVLTA